MGDGIMREHTYLLQYNLQFFANNEGGEKTEEATPKKKEDSRKEGQVAQSKEVVTAVTLLALFLSVKFFMGFLGNRFYECFFHFYGNFDRYVSDGITTVSGAALFNEIMIQVMIMIAPFLAVGLIVGFFATKLQFKWMVTGKPLKPKFEKLNPISGFKRIFSMQSLVNLLLSVTKIILISYVAYTTIVDQVGIIYRLYDMSIPQGLAFMFDLILDMGIKISMVMMVVGAADYMYQRWKHNKDIKMSKQEVKDEYKSTEGDPKVKGQQKQRMMQASQRRMMQSIPQADVVITNPTHFAVALKYDANVSQAPVVTAKGADFLAFKIKDVARENHVEIVENKPLARMLYYNVDLGKEIPPELYQMVADVLAYVYSLQNRVS